MVGGVPATNVNVMNDKTISATMPARPAGTLNAATVSNSDGTTGTLPAGWLANFLDVPGGQQFYDFVVRLVLNGVSGGTGGGLYGVGNPTLRQQMAVFLLKGKHGVCFVPPPCQGLFSDVPCSSDFAPWIEALFDAGITGGCGTGLFCPQNPVRRDQMAPFLIKAKCGSRFRATALHGHGVRRRRVPLAVRGLDRAARARGRHERMRRKQLLSVEPGDAWPDGRVRRPRVRPTLGGPVRRLLVTGLLSFALPASAATFTVTNTAPSDSGSLRQAILGANANPGPDSIVFAIPAPGVQTIVLASPLPAITEPVIIDGFTQPGSSANTQPAGQGLNAVLQIQIDGTGAAAGPCFTINAGNDDLLVMAIQGLVINRCPSARSTSVVGGQRRGHRRATTSARPTGTSVPGPQGFGVRVVNTIHVAIGGTFAFRAQSDLRQHRRRRDRHRRLHRRSAAT